MNYLNDVQVALRNALEQSGVTQRKLAETCGISHALIQSMLTGKSKPKSDRIEPMADALKLEGGERQRFIDSAKRAKSDIDISQELQDLRLKHDDLLSRHEKLKEKVFAKARTKD